MYNSHLSHHTVFLCYSHCAVTTMSIVHRRQYSDYWMLNWIGRGGKWSWLNLSYYPRIWSNWRRLRISR